MATKSEIDALAKSLRNVGPRLAERLLDAGIVDRASLEKLGAKKCYRILYETGDAYGDFNAAYIYALEGAIRDCDWLEIPEDLKTEYKAFTQALQAEKKRAR